MYMRGFALAAAACVGLGFVTLLPPAGAAAKPSGFSAHGGKHFGHHGLHHFHSHAIRHHARRHHARRHHHLRGFPVWSYPLAAIVYRTGDDVTGSIPAMEPQRTLAPKIYRVGSDGGCRSERVQVTTASGQGEVTVIRC
jgi:hypothetical protein